ncbi:MAG: YoaK family protein [Eubacteriales bacterium]|nr:YoaK family protein [Eubacteriales bacterium]
MKLPITDRLGDRKQISESIELAIFLTLSGGFMDAYSYLCRGGVFANAQTGNILLLAVNLSQTNWTQAVRYLFPILSFALGIACSDLIRHHFRRRPQIHWRQITVLLEALIFLLVSFLPQSQNLLANSMTSFACGAQVESFRKINGFGAATTMCIGNLRTATQSLCEYHYTKKRSDLVRSLLFYGVIVVFACGAVIGNLSVQRFAERAILVSCGFMLCAFLMMFIDREG